MPSPLRPCTLETTLLVISSPKSRMQETVISSTHAISLGHTGSSPMDPCNWPLVCQKAQCRHFVDISLPFGLRWAVSCCQDMMSFVVRVFQEQGGSTLNYIDDFWEVTMDEQMAMHHFSLLHYLLKHLDSRRCYTKPHPRPCLDMAGVVLQYSRYDGVHVHPTREDAI